MGFKCGIIGLPNVGKSTIFNALTKLNIKTANFPFCTIKPNIGTVPVPDPRLDLIADFVKPQRIIPTSIEFVDIAGLVKGASKGKGLGNEFLTNIREVEAIVHIVRCFEDENIIHITGKINPIEDIDIVNTELILSDLDICERAIYRISNKTGSSDIYYKNELSVLKKCLRQLENAKMVISLDLNKEEKELIRHQNFLTSKPIIYIANVDKNGFKNNPYLDQVRFFAGKEQSVIIPVCAVFEANGIDFKNKKRDKFITNLDDSGINSVILACYQLLNLKTFFTVGVKEVRAWTLSFSANARQAASKIHSHLEKGFIRIQVVDFKDFVKYKGMQKAKEAGKVHYEGKDYLIQDGDIIRVLFKI